MTRPIFAVLLTFASLASAQTETTEVQGLDREVQRADEQRGQPDERPILRAHRRHVELGQLDRHFEPYGQSGDPDNPHYRDLFDLYVSGKHTPIFFSRKKVESVTEKTIRLIPEAR